jgi:hypothetical protein
MCDNCLSTTNPLCNCENRRCCRCRGTSCIRCCVRNHGQHSHSPVVLDGQYICRHCLVKFTAPCLCCDNPVLDRCNRCCKAYTHICCKPEPVRFRTPPHEPVFVNPPLIPTRGSHVVSSREDSLKILTKQTRINPIYLSKNRFTRYAAVEIEASNIGNAHKLNTVVNNWGCAVVHDTSIGDYGFEINTVPACGDTLLEQLKEICDALVEGKAQVSNRCGLHVHIDCRDYGYQEVQRFISTYSQIETTLFAALHSSRLDNGYCKPCGREYYETLLLGVKPDTKGIKQVLIPAVYGKAALEKSPYYKTPNFHGYRVDHYGRNGTLRNEMRYSAVNLHSYFLRGTIEFRMHHAAIDYVEISGWTKTLVALMDSILHTPSNKITQILQVRQEELEGFRELYEVSWSTPIIKGLIILSSLIAPKYVEHLVSKIKLVEATENAQYLPAELFYNNRTASTAATNQQLSIEASGLTNV